VTRLINVSSIPGSLPVAAKKEREKEKEKGRKRRGNGED